MTTVLIWLSWLAEARWLLVVIEGLIGVGYVAKWHLYGDPVHGWFAVMWLGYAVAALGPAMVGK